MDAVEDRAFVEAPRWIDQNAARRVTGQTVHGHLRRDQLQTITDKTDIIIN